MDKVYNTYRPEGFSTVNSYLFVENPDELIGFLKNAFHAIEFSRTINPSNGDIANCVMKVGHSCLMISQARGQFLNMRSSMYLFVDDVDMVFKNAVEHGAKVEFEPADMDYGDRQGGIQDPSGNYWWISKRLKEEGY